MPPPLVSLGFAEGAFRAGVHVCQVFSDDADRDQALTRFLGAGVRGQECCGCFSDHTSQSALIQELDGQGVDAAGAFASGALSLAGTREAYFSGGRFEPERMLAKLGAFHHDAVARGYPAARLMGEMTNDIEQVPGGSRLLEYEARVSILLRDHPITTVCQYDARCFDGASIMDVLRVHPFVVVRGAIVQNPFYLPPEQFLQQQAGEGA